MPPFQNRRKTDSNLDIVKDHINGLSSKIDVLTALSKVSTEATLASNKANSESHKDFYDDISGLKNEMGKLKTKQWITQVIGGFLSLIGVGVASRWIYSIISSNSHHIK